MPYAFAEYLDIVTKNWKVVVSEDYETVMPFAYNHKLLGVPQIYQPPYTQQLGIFGRYQEDVVVVKAFLDTIPKRYVRINMQLNASNPTPNIKNWTFRRRTNYVLALNRSYKEINKGFRSGHRSSIKKAQKLNTLERGKLSSKKLAKFMGQQKGNRPFAGMQQLIDLFGSESIWSAWLSDGTLGALGFFPTLNSFAEGKERVIYLFGHTTEAGRIGLSGHFLLDKVIQYYAEEEAVLDFEGSELPGVASFFRGFGPIDCAYLVGSRNQI